MYLLAASLVVGGLTLQAPVRYAIQIDTESDLFHVRVELPEGLLEEADEHFDFVAFAPGVHSVLDIGRFVRTVEAADATGAPVACERVGTNRWRLEEPARVRTIDYGIEDTSDSELREHRVIACAGTSIEKDYTLLNTFSVLGYFARHLEKPVELTLDHEPGWSVGTALARNRDGTFRASSYRRLVDSPLLLGDLTNVGIFVGDIEVDIFCHSPVPAIDAEEVLFVAGDVLEAADGFLGFAPVERYAFLLDFLSLETLRDQRIRSMGALEHSYSSVYTFPAMSGALQRLSSTLAHEFMHILTPLHLRSTTIAEFDYSIPTTDGELWLYEGVTEWAAEALRMRGGLVSVEEHLEVLERKIRAAESVRDPFSLDRLSREWATPEGSKQYGNIYQLGALTAAVLDLRILALSDGRRGLREVFLDLIDRYGVERPFDEETFRAEFVEASFPEVGEFLDAHLRRGEELPFASAFRAVGIEYDARTRRFRLDPEATQAELALRDAWTRNLPRE